MNAKLFRNARIYTPLNDGASGIRIALYERGALLVRDGLIIDVGNIEDVLNHPLSAEIDQQIDCMGKCLIPGFVDPHTHMCFASLREQEFAMRLEGTSYLDILKTGGGILSSVKSVRESSDEDLFRVTRKNIETALRHGTTTIEIKSGYGLNTAAEIRMLNVIARVSRETPPDIVSTFMGAHAVPTEFKNDPDGYVDLMVNEMIPLVARECSPSFCDVFCEKGVFTLSQSRRILETGSMYGMGAKIHADEVNDIGGAALAAEIGAVSAEHLLAASEKNLEAMSEAGVIAVLLPATAFSLKKPYANARRMLELGLTVAISTDCNPGSSYTHSMPFVFSLAVLNMNMTIEEALTGCTLNAAKAIGMDSGTGSLEPGKFADLVILDGETPAILAYNSGVNPVLSVYKKGESVFSRLCEWRKGI
ncbi:MAG TPA: imidazolonepropionase [Synergistetes bacterium]|nr:imidazolonepropionase [Synergistota bacterium]